MDSDALTAYIARVGLSGRFPDVNNIVPDLETLQLLQFNHITHIQFETLDPIAKKPISIETKDIVNKLVHSKRGGYCFEHNNLMREVLLRIGYTVTPMLARVRWMAPFEAHTPYDHVTLVVRVPNTEGEFLVDAGFGGLQPLAPLRADLVDQPQTVYGNEYQLVPCGEFPDRIFDPETTKFRMVQWHLPDKWADMFVIRYELADKIDMEVGNWWSCTCPKGLGDDLFVSIVIDLCRYHIINNTYTIRKPDGSAVKETIEGFDRFCELLTGVFNLPVLEGDVFKTEVIKRITQQPQSS
jgi:N-hydroxyarylamine O-acetyltransferase